MTQCITILIIYMLARQQISLVILTIFLPHTHGYTLDRSDTIASIAQFSKQTVNSILVKSKNFKKRIRVRVWMM
jgi:hypothetical protein